VKIRLTRTGLGHWPRPARRDRAHAGAARLGSGDGGRKEGESRPISSTRRVEGQIRGQIDDGLILPKMDREWAPTAARVAPTHVARCVNGGRPREDKAHMHTGCGSFNLFPISTLALLSHFSACNTVLFPHPISIATTRSLPSARSLPSCGPLSFLTTSLCSPFSLHTPLSRQLCRTPCTIVQYSSPTRPPPPLPPPPCISFAHLTNSRATPTDGPVHAVPVLQQHYPNLCSVANVEQCDLARNQRDHPTRRLQPIYPLSTPHSCLANHQSHLGGMVQIRLSHQVCSHPTPWLVRAWLR
jgi:hypothetical protein